MTFTTIEPVLHNGVYYGPGTTIKLEREDAARLVEAKAITPAAASPWGAPAAPAEAPTADPTPLADDFPSRAALVAAGRTTIESLAGLTVENLTAIKGIGEAGATAILAARDAATSAKPE